MVGSALLDVGHAHHAEGLLDNEVPLLGKPPEMHLFELSVFFLFSGGGPQKKTDLGKPEGQNRNILEQRAQRNMF